MRRGVAIAVFAVTIAGCASDGGLPDASLMVRNAALAMGGVTSAHVVLEADGPVPGVPARRIDADVTTGNPSAARGRIEPLAGPAVEFIQIGADLYAKDPAGNYARSDRPGPPSLLTSGSGIAGLLGDVQDPVTAGREDRDGIDSFKVTGVVPAADVGKLVAGAATDATFTIWLRVKGTHLPVDTTLQFPGTAGVLHIKVSDINKKITIATPEVTG